MSATNHTTNYLLPIFVGTDKPAWLVDWNSAMTAIDTALHQIEGKADQAGTDIGGIESSISTINSTLTSINNAVSQLRIDTNANTGNINTINSLIGNGEPTTTDKTLIGAINELHAEVYNFNITNKSVTPSAPSGIVVGDTAMNVLLNEDSSVGKVYGYGNVNISSDVPANGVILHLDIPDLEVTESFIVRGYMLLRYGASGTHPASCYLRFNTNHSVDVISTGSISSSTYSAVWFNLPPCVLFLKNLGD